MSARTKFRDSSYAVVRTSGSITEERHESTVSGRELRWLIGNVVAPDGIVLVYSQDDYSHYSTVINGRKYDRTEQRGRTKRGLAIMAGRFLYDVVTEAHS